MEEQAATQDAIVGLTIGNYEVKSKLGEGGMGSVYMAEHPLIGKKVAVKVLHSEFAANEDVVSRFFTEAKSVNDIQHPNIVDIVDYGVLERPGANMVYFIMEFLDGSALADVIANEAPLNPERSLMIGLQVADALAGSHEKQVVHRDLKPDNVILIERGRQTDFVKVLDFGIAKLTGDQKGSSRTRTGIVMGTPAYMSPEQCEGRGNIDHRTDVYALGVLLFEMLTGVVPFQGEGYGEVLVQHLTQPPPDPLTINPALSPHVAVVCLKALEKKKESRYPTMAAFMAALADPVGFVESWGGLAHFVAADLSGAATISLPTAGIVTPTSLSPNTPTGLASPLLTPVPAGASLYTPTPSPGALTDMDFDPTPPKSRTGLAAGIVAAVLLAGAGVIFAVGGGGKTAATDPTAPTTSAPISKPPGPVAPVVTPPVSAKAKQVKVRLGTNPKGASVWVGDEDKARGTTPVTLEFEQSDRPITIRFELDGHESRTVDLTPSREQDKDISLVKKPTEKVSKRRNKRDNKSKRRDKIAEPKAKPKPTPKPTVPVTTKRAKIGDDTVDPFAD